MELVSRGAEAEVYLDSGIIIKRRAQKSYRQKELDDTLRKSRTRREAKVLEKIPKEIPHPLLFRSDEKDMQIEMSYINGEKIRDVLDRKLELCSEIFKKRKSGRSQPSHPLDEII